MIGSERSRLDPPVPSNRLASLLRPAPDSAVADLLRRGKSPWSGAIHLLWSVWIFLTPALGNGFTLRWLFLTLASYPLFLLLYARVMLAPRHHGPRYALAMVAMSLVLLPWYPSGLSYFVFGCVMMRMSGRSGWWMYLLQLTALNIVFCAAALYFGYPWQALVWMPAVSFIVGLVVNVEALSQQRDVALQLSQEEVRRLATTAERERIGRDLHDLLGHTLSLITLKLELARKLYDRDDARARQEIGEAEAIAREALAQVRSAVTGIRASDLAGELASARLLLECQQVHLHYTVPPPMPVEVERGLALVLREAATNIVRHAQATQARVEFMQEGRQLVMQIRDDGRGGLQAEGNGMCGMRERVAALGGQLQVQSGKGEGTLLTLRVPLAAATTPVPPASLAQGGAA
ncbi:two-component sensor histidine kinase [Stenotrophomonas sp. ZAC14D1_NAIMI4_6]|uniref:sensor histidine kinase n=1 Tax=Stenotrophomonas TaxID=40323 RepID=UPI000D542126|nr:MULTISPECIES: sensor histidine kinase [Stenotrophomonas]AWH35536.1 two-component sensor histidine kinase [Stenotrophomonas sp. ZAC14D1_NAIMI4_6]AWH39666.1 two-component sensor histidine kinase [Stenotrophomonas sp. ZAC14D1_NAIMI4_1]